MKIGILYVVLAICAVPFTALAERPAALYAGQEKRPIKALSDDDVAGLLGGEGLGMAKAAELNGYPGPRHVLMLAAELKLTAAQQQRAQEIFDRMSAAAKPLGAELVEREQGLDQLFAKNEITPERLAAATAAIGELGARLRSVHLAAHIDTRALLDPEQLVRYQRLRGYGHPGGPASHPRR